METNVEISKFIESFAKAFCEGTFVKLKVNKLLNKHDELQEVFIRSVKIKKNIKLSFIYHYKTKDITKNFTLEEGVKHLKTLFGTKFKNFVLFTINNDIRLSYSRKMKTAIHYGKPSISNLLVKNHNKEKHRFIQIEDNQYLKELGVVTQNNRIAQDMGAKYKQICRYIETLDSVIKKSNLANVKKMNIVDMGSGKGYLTFAVYDHLLHNLQCDIKVTGVEMKKDLVDFCNIVAKKANFKNLQFVQNTIHDYPVQSMDILMTLHACDTATDDAIYKGICGNCSIIILSPCCHRQIRKNFNVTNKLSDIVKHGILEERMAEIVTDTMRGLILEAYGYKTQIFEFISDGHTHKNLMIIGIKNNKKINKLSLEKIKSLKEEFGIEKFYLEDLFNKTL